MHLTRQNLPEINSGIVELPGADYFSLPEKVLQFGTGVLLRGLPDYFIDKANKQGVFNGRIVVLKSTDAGELDSFARQDGLYTHKLQGITDGSETTETVLNACISRVLAAKNDWDEVLQLARSADLQLIVSNTTEVGIVLVEDSIHNTPPVSFPGKLLAFLYERYRHFNGDPAAGLVIVPTELIPQNADTLRSILLQLSDQNNLKEGFRRWLEQSNIFCNSLVDRIVPGKLPATEVEAMEKKLGYQDELMIMSETYGLWAIEASDEMVYEVLSFYKCDSGVVITPDISVHRELKLRLLNGSHTFTCGLAVLCGFETVKQAMDNPVFEKFISTLVMQEIAPSIDCKGLSLEQARSFAAKVLDRYRNPSLQHHWISITLHYTSKMNTRNAGLVKNYLDRHSDIPSHMALGLAAWILFMKTENTADGSYMGQAGGREYRVNDAQASLFHEFWKKYPTGELVDRVFSDKNIWQVDIPGLAGLAAEVKKWLDALIELGAMEAMSRVVNASEPAAKADA